MQGVGRGGPGGEEPAPALLAVAVLGFLGILGYEPRRANAALYRIVIVGMRLDDRTNDYLRRRTTEGKTKSEIIRCLKRHPIREIWRTTRDLRQDPQPTNIP